MNILGAKLRESVQKHGLDSTLRLVDDFQRERKISKENFSLAGTAQAFMGDGFGDKLETAKGRAFAMASRFGDNVPLRESYGSVDVSNFVAISGQLLVNTVREKYDLATQYTREMFTVEPITNGNISTEREPGLTYVKTIPTTNQNVAPGVPYPHAEFGPTYIDKPAPQKFGEVCRVQIEQVISDRTRQVFESAESVGKIVGVEEEMRKLKVMFGVVNPFSWNGTAYNTYLTTGAWVNSSTTFAFVDWNSMNTLEQFFNNMTDPYTGLPIEVEGKDILTVPTLKYPFRRTLNATEIRYGNAATNTTVSSNVLDKDYNLWVSKNARKVLVDAGFTTTQADTFVLNGDFKAAFGWREVWPGKVVQAPPQNDADFNQDIVLQVKASWYGVAYVREPRKVARGYTA